MATEKMNADELRGYIKAFKEYVYRKNPARYQYKLTKLEDELEQLAPSMQAPLEVLTSSIHISWLDSLTSLITNEQIKLKCIDSSEKPHEIPDELWIKKDEIYCIKKLIMHPVKGKEETNRKVYAATLKEIDSLNTVSKKYLGYAIERFEPIECEPINKSKVKHFNNPPSNINEEVFQEFDRLGSRAGGITKKMATYHARRIASGGQPS